MMLIVEDEVNVKLNNSTLQLNRRHKHDINIKLNTLEKIRQGKQSTWNAHPQTEQTEHKEQIQFKSRHRI